MPGRVCPPCFVPLVAAICALLLGCASQPEPPPRLEGAARHAKPLGYIEWMAHSDRFRPVASRAHSARPDSWLLWRVQSVLAEPTDGRTNVRVEVESQNVILTGSVSDRETADQLIDSIKEIRGVVHIADLMTIEP